MNNNDINTDTIAALATPRGVGAIAIIRLSGDRAIDIAAGLVRNPAIILEAEQRTLHLVEFLAENGDLLDQGLCALFRKPYSYTGENSAELYLHGSPYIISRILERCRQLGAHPANPGEFTQRAFLNGKMDLTQAEAVADLISSTGAAAHRAALSQMEGALSHRLGRIRDQVLQIRALVELDIDFSDQDIPVVQNDKLLINIEDIQRDLRELAGSYERGRLAREGAVVVIAGPPNVGKSTLFNALLGEDKAIVDAAPGTTRDAVEAVVEWGGLCLRLMDTAGQADNFQGPDRQAVYRARTVMQSANLVIWVADLSSTQQVIMPPYDVLDRLVLVGNKVDQVLKIKLELSKYLPVSARDCTGIEELKAKVLKQLLPENDGELSEGLLTRERHLDAVRRAEISLANGVQVLTEGRGIELLAEDLREASNALGEILGEVTTDDILNRIFAEFCLGK
jgi:tRNA modification GTPase